MLRIEGFADAVFGFALTLLVVSLEVPNTFDELLATMRGFFAFAISGSLLYSVWFDHYRFFRRYGLQDTQKRCDYGEPRSLSACASQRNLKYICIDL